MIVTERSQVLEVYAEAAEGMLRDISQQTLACYDMALQVVFTAQTDAQTEKQEDTQAAVQAAEHIQAAREAYRAGHMERVASGAYNVEAGIAFMEVVRHMSRIASHAKGMVESLY